MGIKKFASQNEKILISRSISESKILKLRKIAVRGRGPPDVTILFLEHFNFEKV